MPPPLIALPAALSCHALSKSVAATAVSADAYACYSASILYCIARYLWNAIPPWIQEDVAIQNLILASRKNHRKDSSSSSSQLELGTLSSVLEKLQSLSQTVSSKLFGSSSDDAASSFNNTVPYIHASLLAYIQLSSQLQVLYPNEFRNQYYNNSNQLSSPPSSYCSTRKNNGDDERIDRAKEDICLDNSSGWGWCNWDTTTTTRSNTTAESRRLVFPTLSECLQLTIWAYESDTLVLQESLQSMDTTPTVTTARYEFEMLQHNTLISSSDSSSSDVNDGKRQRQKQRTPPSSQQRPGQVGHYMAISHAQQLVVIAIRGTSTLEDFFTDCCGQAVCYTNHKEQRSTMSDYEADTQQHPRVEVRAQQSPEVLYVPQLDNMTSPIGTESEHCDEIEILSGHEQIWIEDPGSGVNDDATRSTIAHPKEYSIRCHEGILICAQRVVNKIQPIIEQYVLGQGYRALVCGHSLGGGVASLVGMVLRTRFPILAHPMMPPSPLTSNTMDQQSSRLCDNAQPTPSPHHQQQQLLRVVAFAPPPVLDHDSAIAASSYTVSIVNNTDIIPRASLANLAVFVEFLRSVSARLVERNLAPTNPATCMALLQKLWCTTTTEAQNVVCRQEEDDPSNLLMTLSEVQRAMNEAHQQIELRHPDHLYIPGRVLLLYENWGSHNAANDEKQFEFGPTSSTKETVPSETEKRQRIKKNVTNTLPESRELKFVVTDGTATALRFFEFDSFRMISDHTTASYTKSVTHFCHQGFSRSTVVV